MSALWSGSRLVPELGKFLSNLLHHPHRPEALLELLSSAPRGLPAAQGAGSTRCLPLAWERVVAVEELCAALLCTLARLTRQHRARGRGCGASASARRRRRRRKGARGVAGGGTQTRKAGGGVSTGALLDARSANGPSEADSSEESSLSCDDSSSSSSDFMSRANSLMNKAVTNTPHAAAVASGSETCTARTSSWHRLAEEDRLPGLSVTLCPAAVRRWTRELIEGGLLPLRRDWCCRDALARRAAFDLLLADDGGTHGRRLSLARFRRVFPVAPEEEGGLNEENVSHNSVTPPLKHVNGRMAAPTTPLGELNMRSHGIRESGLPYLVFAHYLCVHRVGDAAALSARLRRALHTSLSDASVMTLPRLLSSAVSGPTTRRVGEMGTTTLTPSPPPR